MFNRASRDFQPLVTTFCQMRLRNLIKISAVNLDCDKNLAIYFTLHLSAFSKPFYTSKSIEIHSNNVMWPEINCEKCRESSQKFICIRVWQQNANNNNININNNNKNNTIDNNNEKTTTTTTTADKMLFLWGVYFSGLVLVSKSSEDLKYKKNTLLFHLDGGIFSSSDQIVHHQHNPNTTIPLSIQEAEQNCDKTIIMDRYSNSSVNSSNSSSPPKSQPPADEQHSNVVSILNEAKFYKVRYAHLKFPKNETQSSYTLEKLLQIQEIQREIKSLKDRSKTIAERICVKSPACINLDAISTKAIYFEPQKQPGMGKTLSRLLAQAPPKPEIVIKSHELKKQIECLRFKIKLLMQEKDRSRQHIKQLISKREKLKDDNIEMETLIWNNVRTLNRENLRVYDEKLALQREVFVNIRLALLETRRFLLMELNEIYCVKKCDRFYTINGIHLPDAESYADTQSTSVEISIALGYVAHAVLIISRILNVPLRNAIKHEGSRSKIVDNIKILPPTDRV
jgi:UV radiation resistance-associated gene protein